MHSRYPLSRFVPAITDLERRIFFISGCFLMVFALPLVGQVEVPEGFTFEQWSVPGVEKIEAVRNPEYGNGTIGAFVEQDTLVLWRSSSADDFEVLSRTAVQDDTNVFEIRFDHAGIYNHYLLLDMNRNLHETTIATISPDGALTPRATLGSGTNNISGRL